MKDDSIIEFFRNEKNYYASCLYYAFFYLSLPGDNGLKHAKHLKKMYSSLNEAHPKILLFWAERLKSYLEKHAEDLRHSKIDIKNVKMNNKKMQEKIENELRFAQGASYVRKVLYYLDQYIDYYQRYLQASKGKKEEDQQSKQDSDDRRRELEDGRGFDYGYGHPKSSNPFFTEARIFDVDDSSLTAFSNSSHKPISEVSTKDNKPKKTNVTSQESMDDRTPEIDVNDPSYYMYGFRKVFPISKDDICVQLECLLEMGIRLDNKIYSLLFKDFQDNFEYYGKASAQALQFLEMYAKAYKIFSKHSRDNVEYAIQHISPSLKENYCKKFGLSTFTILSPEEIKLRINSRISRELSNTKFYYGDSRLYRQIYNRISLASFLMSEEEIFSLYKKFMDNAYIENDRDVITRIFAGIIANRRMTGRENEKEKETIELAAKAELRNCLEPSVKHKKLQEALKAADERYYGLSRIQRTLDMAGEYARYMDILFACRNSNMSEEELESITEELNGMFR